MPIGRDGHVAGKAISPGFPGLSHAGYTQAERDAAKHRAVDVPVQDIVRVGGMDVAEGALQPIACIHCIKNAAVNLPRAILFERFFGVSSTPMARSRTDRST